MNTPQSSLESHGPISDARDHLGRLSEEVLTLNQRIVQLVNGRLNVPIEKSQKTDERNTLYVFTNTDELSGAQRAACVFLREAVNASYHAMYDAKCDCERHMDASKPGGRQFWGFTYGEPSNVITLLQDHLKTAAVKIKNAKSEFKEIYETAPINDFSFGDILEMMKYEEIIDLLDQAIELTNECAKSLGIGPARSR